MATNENILTEDNREVIRKIHADLRSVSISKQEIDAILAKIPSKDLSGLMESISHLDRNNCLTRHTFERISVRTRKNNFSLLNTYHIIKALDRQSILNRRNIDLIFNSNSSSDERIAWKFMMPGLIDIGYFNQANIDKIFLHQNFENLMRGFAIFSQYSWFFSASYLDKMIEQKELKNFVFITDFIPYSVWQDWDKLSATYSKLLQCNAQLGNRDIVVKNTGKMDYRYVEEGTTNNLLDRCIAANTPEAAISVFADQPRPLSYEEMNKLDGLSVNNPTTLPSVPVLEQPSSLARVGRSVRSIGFAREGMNSEAPQTESGVIQNRLGTDTLLLGSYLASGLFKLFGGKNIALGETQAALNESVVNFKGNKISHIEETLRAAEKQYEGNGNSSFVLSPAN